MLEQHFPHIPDSAESLPNSYWEVDLDDPTARETDEQVRERMSASGIDVDHDLSAMVASMGRVFGDPAEIIDGLVAELPPEYVDRILENPDSLTDILEELETLDA